VRLSARQHGDSVAIELRDDGRGLSRERIAQAAITRGLIDPEFALLVDELLGQQQVVAKSLGGAIGQVQGVSGGAILGDGRVGLILDPAGMSALARGDALAATGRSGLLADAQDVAA
jgi:chemotaxis protein histidine kinase CheA